MTTVRPGVPLPGVRAVQAVTRTDHRPVSARAPPEAFLARPLGFLCKTHGVHSGAEGPEEQNTLTPIEGRHRGVDSTGCLWGVKCAPSEGMNNDR